MASSRAKVGVNCEPNSLKESKSNGSSQAGEAAPNKRIYCLDDLETVATVGELQEPLQNWTVPIKVVPGFCTVRQTSEVGYRYAMNEVLNLLQVLSAAQL